MSALLRYVLRHCARRRTRTVLGILGIFLTIALLTAIQIGLDSVSTSYLDLVALQAGKADLLITREGSNPINPDPFDPAAVIKVLATNPHLRGLAPRFIGIVQVQAGGQEQFAMLIGIDPERERALDISGLAPEPALPKDTCAVSKALAQRLSVENGARLSVTSPTTGGFLDLRLETILNRQLILPQEVREYIVVQETAARSLLGESERVHMLAGAFHKPRSYYDARDLHASVLKLKNAGEALAADLGMDYDLRLPKAAAITAFQNFTSPLRAIFGVFALLALSVTGLLIYSILSVAVEERIREYAILRAVGAKRHHIVRLVLTESFLLCFLGVAPGVLAGVLLAQGAVNLIELIARVQGDVIALEVSPLTLVLTLAGGAILSVGSALVPALHAVRWRIVDALDPLRRGQIRPPRSPEEGIHPAYWVTGLVLSTLAVVIFFVLPTAFLSGNPSLIGAVILCLLLTILLGFTLVAVGALPLAERLILAPIGWLLGPAAELARMNLVRHRRRNTTTALMFILSVALVILIASLVALFSRTAISLAEHMNGADFRLQSDSFGGETLRAELRGIRGVEQVSEVRSLRSRSERGIAYDVVMSDLVGMKHLWVVPYGVDANLPRVLYTNQIQYQAGGPGALAELAAPAPAENQPNAQTSALPPLILSLSAARYLDIQLGDLVQLSFRLGSARRDGRFRVTAICGALPGFNNFRSRIANAVGSGALIPLANFQSLTEAAPAEAFQTRYFVKAQADATVQKAVAQKIRDTVDVRYRFGVKSTLEQQRDARILYWVTQVFFGLVLAMAVVIAVFALIASMATAVIERRWEIGVLKALGLRRSQLFRMFLGEALVLTLAAGAAGGAIGFLLAYLFVLEAAVLVEIPMVFTMPYVAFLATFVISLLAGAVTAHLPTRGLLRKSAAEILRLEV